MNDAVQVAAATPARTEAFDVLIVGAGISGIGGAYHLTQQCPGTSFVILKSQASFGGTWRTHRYPGIRSDSDLLHLRLPLQALARRADRHGRRDPQLHGRGDRGERPRPAHPLPPPDRLRALVERARTSGRSRRRGPTPARRSASPPTSCGCARATTATPRAIRRTGQGMERFRGRIVHPQTWPDDLDYRDKKVLVIGSGATAATLDPGDRATTAPTSRCCSARRPISVTGRNAIEIADELRELQVDEDWIHEIVRRKILYEQAVVHPALVRRARDGKQELLGGVARISAPTTMSRRTSRRTIGPGGSASRSCPTATCSRASPRQGFGRHRRDRAVHRDRHPAESGRQLEADIIVTATGFHLSVLGDIAFGVDGGPLDFADTVTYRGMMFTGVPNMAWVFGYFRASWTLRVDLVADFVCRLLNHMQGRARERRGGAAAGGPGHAAAAMDRPGQLQPGLRDARHAPAAEARRQAGMAAHAGLLEREGPVPGDRPRRRRVRLRLNCQFARAAMGQQFGSAVPASPVLLQRSDVTGFSS